MRAARGWYVRRLPTVGTPPPTSVAVPPSPLPRPALTFTPINVSFAGSALLGRLPPPAIRPATVPAPINVAKAEQHRESFVWLTPPKPSQTLAVVIPPCPQRPLVIVRDWVREALVYRAALPAARSSPFSVARPLIWRGQFERGGIAYVTKPPLQKPAAPTALPSTVVRGINVYRRGLVYRNVVPSVPQSVAGGAMPARIWRGDYHRGAAVFSSRLPLKTAPPVGPACPPIRFAWSSSASVAFDWSSSTEGSFEWGC